MARSARYTPRRHRSAGTGLLGLLTAVPAVALILGILAFFALLAVLDWLSTVPWYALVGACLFAQVSAVGGIVLWLWLRQAGQVRPVPIPRMRPVMYVREEPQAAPSPHAAPHAAPRARIVNEPGERCYWGKTFVGWLAPDGAFIPAAKQQTTA